MRVRYILGDIKTASVLNKCVAHYSCVFFLYYGYYETKEKFESNFGYHSQILPFKC
jgi:hypothetical protein